MIIALSSDSLVPRLGDDAAAAATEARAKYEGKARLAAGSRGREKEECKRIDTALRGRCLLLCAHDSCTPASTRPADMTSVLRR